MFDAYEYTAPARWASYLINGDASGIDDQDKDQADRFVAAVGKGDPVNVEEAGFSWRNDAMTLIGVPMLGADIATYTFLVPIPA